MHAVTLAAPREFQAIELPEPHSPGPGEALVKISRVGVCGTDIAGYLGKMPFIQYPRILGHELGVEVLSVGDDVTHLQPGDTCSVEPYLNNPNSLASRRGMTNCCQDLQVLGVHTDGGLRERMILPARKLHRSRKLSLDQLALVETLAIGCHAVNRANVQPGETALVIGAGPIGLTAIEFARLAGARVVVMDTNPQRLEFCRRALGIEETIVAQADGKQLEQFTDLTAGALADCVFDATGNAASMGAALNYAGHGGRVVYVGIYNGEVSFFDPLLHRRELTLLATRNAVASDFTRIIDLIETGRLDTRPWITHRTTLAKLPGEFAAFTLPENGVVKALVEVG